MMQLPHGPLFFSLSLSPSLFFSLSLPISLTHSLSLFLPLPSLSLSLFLSLSLPLSIFLSLSIYLSLSLCLCLSLSLSHHTLQYVLLFLFSPLFFSLHQKEKKHYDDKGVLATEAAEDEHTGLVGTSVCLSICLYVCMKNDSQRHLAGPCPTVEEKEVKPRGQRQPSSETTYLFCPMPTPECMTDCLFNV